MVCAFSLEPSPEPIRCIHRDGALFRDTTGGYWVVYGGARFAIRDTEVLAALSLSPSFAEPISLFRLSQMSRLPEQGTVLREVSSNQVFIVTDRAVVPLTESTVRFGKRALIAVVPDGSVAEVRAVMSCLF